MSPEIVLAPTIEKAKLPEQKSFMQKTDELVEVLRHDASLFELKRQGASTKTAIETTSLLLSTSEDQGYSESEKNIFGVIARLGSYVTSQRRAGELSREAVDHKLNVTQKNEIDNLKSHDLIPFNHAIKELINTESSSTKDELDASLTRLYMRLFARDDPKIKDAEEQATYDQNVLTSVSSDALTFLSASIDGMRHEISSETMLTAAEVDYRYDVTTEEDKNGTDIFVYLDGRWEKVDIKSSQMSATNALVKRPHSHTVWTGLNPSDFTGAKGDQVNGLRISFETAQQKAPVFVSRIRNAVKR